MGPKGGQGPQGPQGTQGPQGPPGPPGPMAKVDNSTLNKSCNETKDYGQIKYSNYNVQVCTPTGWKSLALKEDICDNSSVPRIDLETFKISKFGALFQFNDNLRVNLSPGSVATSVNLTAAFEDHASNNTVPEYLPSAMSKAIRLKGRKHINLIGIPVDFWSGNEWSVMALIKFTDQGLNSQKEIPVIGAGGQQNGKGFHLGIRSKRVLHGFYSNDMIGDAILNFDQWYQITWTWKKASPTGTRQIFVNGVLDKKQDGTSGFNGKSDNTEIGAWWNDTSNRNNNIQIDTLYIIDKVVDYKSKWTSTDWLELCQARLVNNDMP
ncbi:uncharacterized protein LOC116299945 isoform X2 [Actinia tenebrosa]|nr:uncharacterized protein LOC116299945 isoform X2 [Actinia tenebrosa]